MALRFKVAPLSGTFMLTSIIGFLISTLYLAGIPGAESFAVSFALLFGIMFIASVISMTYTPVEIELAIDEHHEVIKKRKRVIPHEQSRKYIIKQSLKGSMYKAKEVVGIKSKSKVKPKTKITSVSVKNKSTKKTKAKPKTKKVRKK